MVEIKETIKTKKSHKKKIMAIALFLLFVLNFLAGFFLGKLFGGETIYKDPDIIRPLEITNSLMSRQGRLEGSDAIYHFSYFELSGEYYLVIKQGDMFINTIRVGVDQNNLSTVVEQLYFATISHFATVLYIEYIKKNHNESFDTFNNPISITNTEEGIIAKTENYPGLTFERRLEESETGRETIILAPIN